MYDFVIPKMGMATTEAEIMDWKVKVGDKVKKGDPIVEVESEKASVVLESERSGVVTEILYKNGETVELGNVICRIKEE